EYAIHVPREIALSHFARLLRCDLLRKVVENSVAIQLVVLRFHIRVNGRDSGCEKNSQKDKYLRAHQVECNVGPIVRQSKVGLFGLIRALIESMSRISSNGHELAARRKQKGGCSRHLFASKSAKSFSYFCV